MTNERPTITEILHTFFAMEKADKQPELCARFEAVEHRLRSCIEEEAERILVDEDLELVRRERELGPGGAVARLGNAEDLIFLLSIFVEPRWQPLESAQRTIQLVLTQRLASYVVARGLVDAHGLACPLLDIRVAVDRGKSEWRRQRTLGRERNG
jgi:hypothetical protein